jgi:hypothetical protein
MKYVPKIGPPSGDGVINFAKIAFPIAAILFVLWRASVTEGDAGHVTVEASKSPPPSLEGYDDGAVGGFEWLISEPFIKDWGILTDFVVPGSHFECVAPSKGSVDKDTTVSDVLGDKILSSHGG